jgi:hypothetical protein
MKMTNGQVHAQLVKFGKPPAKDPSKAQGSSSNPGRRWDKQGG